MTNLFKEYLFLLQLLQEEVISRENFEKALAYFKDDKNKHIKKNIESESDVGRVLVSLEFCKEEAIAKSIAKSANVEYMTLEEVRPIYNAIGKLPFSTIKNYKIVPINVKKDILTVAMDTPNDVKLIEHLKELSKMEIKPIVLPDSELHELMSEYEASASDKEMPYQKNTNKTSPKDTQKDNNPITKLSEQIIQSGIHSNATEIHIEKQIESSRVRLRIDGTLHDTLQIPANIHDQLIARFKLLANLDINETIAPQEGKATLTFNTKKITVRFNTFPTISGENITLKLINKQSSITPLEQLGLPDVAFKNIENFSKEKSGLILITGPKQSGKSHTLYSFLDKLNTENRKTISIEDSIEKNILGINQIEINHNNGVVLPNILNAISRTDPDIIAIDEISKRDTMGLSLDLSSGKQLVIGTINTKSFSTDLSYLYNMQLEPYLLSTSLIAIISERLVKILCDDCKRQIQIPNEHITSFIPDFPLDANQKDQTFFEPVGCEKCNHTGFSGRKGVFEILRVTDNIREGILHKFSKKTILQTATKEGFLSIRHQILILSKNGITPLTEIPV